jgi:hypothetical protein
MLPTDPQATSSLQGDILALDSLFKRIAERGRKLRTQNKTADSDNLGKETLSAEQDSKPEGKESTHERL